MRAWPGIVVRIQRRSCGRLVRSRAAGPSSLCMRDVSHQALGAHMLGLAGYTQNMLHKFAKNISESKDVCNPWESNRDNVPAPVDYLDDAHFWYNLPANFDVLDVCYRMYAWTGDQTYVTDSAFLNFYGRTVHDYVDPWDLGPGARAYYDAAAHPERPRAL